MINLATSPKERKTDRILVIKPIEGKSTLSSTGLVDPRLFTGENKLHAIMDTRNTLWYLKLDSGGLAEPLKQRFKTFDSLLSYTKRYFDKRNLQITEIID